MWLPIAAAHPLLLITPGLSAGGYIPALIILTPVGWQDEYGSMHSSNGPAARAAGIATIRGIKISFT